MTVISRLLCVLLLAATAYPQSGVGVVTLPYSLAPGLPTGALQADVHNPVWGFPTTFSPCGASSPACAWPCATSIGDIDNDGALDFLIVMEQRLVLALGFTRDSQGTPVGLYVIFAHWDPTTKVFKAGWGHDTAAIADFDGDGKNEVACLLGPGTQPSGPTCSLGSNPTQGSYRVAILEAPAPGSNPDPNFNHLDAPVVLADWPINTAPHGNWTCGLLHGTNGSNMNVHAAHVTPNADPTDSEPRDIVISDGQNRRIAVLRYDPGTGSLLSLHDIVPDWTPFMGTGSGTHTTHAYDLDGDGFDELLNNGVIDLNGGCSWDFWSIPFFASCSNQYNHADSLHPIDHDGDGDLELVAVHDCWDFLVEGNATACVPSVIWHNTNAPALHGQALCVGEFISGADCFGKTAREILVTPKGIPGTTGITSGAQWSYMYNGDSWELAFCYPASGPAGPRDFSSRNFDWDGDRTTDEIYSRYGGTHEVWSVVPDPAWSGPTGTEPDLTGFPAPGQAGGNWPPFPYKFELKASFTDMIWSGGSSSLTCDFSGDYREELVIAGRGGVQIFSNLDPLATPAAHPSPWTDLEYRRRMQSEPVRTVNYQRLGSLERVEVVPAVVGAAPGSQVTYQAWGIYDNGAREDVTAHAVFDAGALGGFSGNVFSAGSSQGLCSVRATVHGVESDNAAVVNITADSKPVIVYAGYADSYVSGTPSEFVVEIGVADVDDNVALVQMAYQGSPVPG